MVFELAGLKFRNPLLVASGPATRHVDQLVEAERCGWGGVSLKLAIEPAAYINLPPRYRWWRKQQVHAFSAEARLTLDEALRLADEGRRRARDLVILANMTYAGQQGTDGWIAMARRFVGAGAHAVELNMCCPNMSFNLEVSGQPQETWHTGASFGQDAQAVAEVVSGVVEAVDVPVFVKLTPEGGRIARVARACFDAGAHVVGTTANRLAIPEFDIRRPVHGPFPLQRQPSLACFSGGWIKPLALRDVFEIRKLVGPEPCILGTGGVRNHVDAVQMMMCGADMIGICTEVMIRGFGILGELLQDIEQFMAEQGYRCYRDFRDLHSGALAAADRLTLEEAYAKVDPELCADCGRCLTIGHCRAISMEDTKAVVLRQNCTGCCTCVDVCPVGAITLGTAADDPAT